MHLIPQRLTGEGILTLDEVLELLVDDDGGFLVDGAVETLESGGGADFKIEGGDGGLRGSGGSVAIGLGAEFVVDV